ncbi:MAG: VCBS repeat-containing protein [Planctomycetota bacterium]
MIHLRLLLPPLLLTPATALVGPQTPDAIRFATRLELQAGAGPVGMAIADLDGDRRAELIVQTREPGGLIVWSGLEPGLERQRPSVQLELPPFGVGPVVCEGPTVVAGRAEPPALLGFAASNGDAGLALEPGAEVALEGELRRLVSGRFAADAPELVAVALHDREADRGSIRLFDWPSEVGRAPLGDGLPTCVHFAPRAGLLLVGCQRGPSLRLLALENGTLSERASIALPGIPRSIAEVELDGDPAPELLVAGGADAAWAFGFEDPASYADTLGRGELGTVVTWNAGGLPIAALRPLAESPNEEGAPAVLVCSLADRIVAKAERFTRAGPVEPLSLYAGASPMGLGQGDLNADGRAELLVANPETGSVAIWFAGPDGLPAPTLLPAANTPFSLIAADLDGDGRPDPATLSAVEDLLLVDLSRSGTAVRVPCGPGAVAARFSDLDGDGHRDLVLLRQVGASASVEALFGDGTGALAPDPRCAAFPLGREAVAFEASDAGGELVVLLGADGELVRLRGAREGFRERERLPLSGRGTGLALALDGDGRVAGIAVAETSPKGSAVRFLTAGDRARLLGSTPLPRPAGSLAVGDLNGDGQLDLAAALGGVSGNHPGDVFAVLDAFGAEGGRRRAEPVPTGPTPSSIDVADLNGDGRAEVVVTSLALNLVHLWTWSEERGGHLTPSWDLGAHRACVDVLCIDLDGPGGDGRPELLVCNNHSSDLSVIRIERSE